MTLPAILLVDLALNLSEGHKELLETVSRSASLIASTLLVWLSVAEHKRSIRPSTLVVLYLLLTCAWDAFALTYPGFSEIRDGSRTNAALVAGFASRLAILTLESQEKQSILNTKYSNRSPEETAGLISSLLFWWMNGLLSRGNRSILRGSQLPPLGSRLEAERLRRDILPSWDNRCELQVLCRLYRILFVFDLLQQQNLKPS